MATALCNASFAQSTPSRSLLRFRAAAVPNALRSWGGRPARTRAAVVGVRCGADPVVIKAQPLTKEAFAPFGQVCTWQKDMKPYDEDDAVLNLSNGIPRFYIMRLPGKGLKFNNITHHKKTTQSLGALGERCWYMALAEKSVAEPTVDDLTVFEIPPGTFVNMKEGTWHAGPYFEGGDIDFYNLELHDTNVTDHTNHGLDPVVIEV